jgi:glyoxylase-like metal-dependent hydrolase (beta-lactamase superfamily II)
MAKIHHLNCISTCPLGGKLMDGFTPSIVRRGELTLHCLLVELPDCLVLVDTGLGRLDVANPRSRLSRFFLSLVSPDFRDEMTAFRQVQSLGYQPRDVRHIVLTHLDFDHAGGLDDFPWATVHLLATERDYAVAQRTWMDRQRFRPQQWSTREAWQTYAATGGDTWFGFDQVQPLRGILPEIAMIPLPGHTFGHAGIAVQGEGDRWLLMAGDAYFYRGEMDQRRPHCTPGLRFYQWMLEKDRHARFESQRRLRELARDHGSAVHVCCGHDLVEFEAIAKRRAAEPATSGTTTLV